MRPAVKSYRGSRVSVSLSLSDSVAFRSVLQGSGCTLFMGCLASVNGLFYRYSGQTDQVIGSPIAGVSMPVFPVSWVFMRTRLLFGAVLREKKIFWGFCRMFVLCALAVMRTSFILLSV
ncbi:hypothetical protein OHD16_27205 [Sphingobacterium sp. ML3W]